MYRTMLVATAVLIGCQPTPNERAGTGSTGESTPGGEAGSAGAASTPRGSATQTFFITPSGLNPGQSNVDPGGRFTFGHTLPLTDAFVSALKTETYFLSGDGTKTPSNVEAAAPKSAADPPSLQLVATQPLAPDTWHWLVIDQSGAIRVAGAEDGLWATHFFTGSAPRVIRVEASLAKNTDLLNVRFSEPVDVAKIAASAFVQLEGSPVGSCLLRGTDCLDPKQPFVTASVDVRLTKKFAPGNLKVSVR